MAPKPAVAPTAEVAQLELKGLVLPGQAAEEYSVELQWQGDDLFTERWWVEREDAEGTRVLARLSPQSKRYVDKEVETGEQYRYGVRAVADGQSVLLGQIVTRIPRDWIVERGYHAWPGGAFGRLYLRRGAIVQMADRDLHLNLLGLESDGGRIETFSEESTAGFGLAGARGARIEIRAEAATGEIDIVSRGQRGGPGRDGRPGQSGKAGEPGKSGRWVFDHVGEKLASLGMRTDPKSFWKEVSREAHGTDGEAGQAGEDGTAGGPGGASGGVYLEVKAATGFLPRVRSIGGEGGRPGIGGAGGLGGAGGAGAPTPTPARWPFKEPPASARPGHPGKDGPKGSDGIRGEEGREGPVCVILDGKKVLGCETAGGPRE